MTNQFKHTLYRDNDSEIEVTIEYDYTPFRKGAREYPGGPAVEPDEGPEVDVCTVKDQSGIELKLTEAEGERAYEACCEDVDRIQGRNEESAAEFYAEMEDCRRERD